MANKSSYGIAAQEICELFGDYLAIPDSSYNSIKTAGSRIDHNVSVKAGFGSDVEEIATRPILVISFMELGEAAVMAIEKSMDSLGYITPACAYAQIAPDDTDTPLDASALTMLVEGLDPLHLIVTDGAVVALLQEAYRMELELDRAARIMGRTSAVFQDLQQLISTDAGKRKAWELFKALK